jgi:hypothetical protein
LLLRTKERDGGSEGDDGVFGEGPRFQTPMTMPATDPDRDRWQVFEKVSTCQSADGAVRGIGFGWWLQEKKMRKEGENRFR